MRVVQYNITHIETIWRNFVNRLYIMVHLHVTLSNANEIWAYTKIYVSWKCPQFYVALSNIWIIVV